MRIGARPHPRKKLRPGAGGVERLKGPRKGYYETGPGGERHKVVQKPRPIRVIPFSDGDRSKETTAAPKRSTVERPIGIRPGGPGGAMRRR